MKRMFLNVSALVLALGFSAQDAHGQRPPKGKGIARVEASAPVAGAEHGPTGLWETTVRVGNASFKLAQIPAGSYQMGTSATEVGILAASRPIHDVTLSRSFWMGKAPVTQGQWQVVMGSNPAGFKQAGLEAPVEQVSWDDVQNFLTRLNGVQSQWTFRLPTEAEWEYACRAGSQGERYGEVDVIAWYSQNSGKTTHPVGQKQANAFGLYDMNGNVWQWCQDWYGDYPKGSVTDPEGKASDMYGQVRVVRGGSWEVDGLTVRSATRNYNLPETRSAGLGFRMVAVLRSR